MNVSRLLGLLPLSHHLGVHEVTWAGVPPPFVYRQILSILQNSAHGFMRSFIQDRIGQD